MVNATPRPLYPGRDPIPILVEAVWAPGPVWTGAENLAPIRIRSPDPPGCSESLYRLSYPGLQEKCDTVTNCYVSMLFPTLYGLTKGECLDAFGGSAKFNIPRVGSDELDHKNM